MQVCIMLKFHLELSLPTWRRQDVIHHTEGPFE
jgi:hypothetical protein